MRRALPLPVAIWSILELPIDPILTPSPTEGLVSVEGRLTWVAFAFGAMYKNQFVSVIFLFLCAVSSLVIATALPMEYESSPIVFSVLLVDLVLKRSAVLIVSIVNVMAPYSR
ncbi:hypothetical protein [Burkholderia sp. SCN-KJ]|uniref:hypothetical protein n=1 Tax=Burkholderia sp. SCN-KJ TaxID=2969248 RepID=UPI00214F6CB8|nr:hypothetical protein [Burkholderia sp. SCN-KJ]MCR4470482.1 hypothetical protein [Burkholderia sp. SCN-KJ]